MFYKWEILGGIIGIRKVYDDSLNTTAALSNLKEFAPSENHENYLPKTTWKLIFRHWFNHSMMKYTLLCRELTKLR